MTRDEALEWLNEIINHLLIATGCQLTMNEFRQSWWQEMYLKRWHLTQTNNFEPWLPNSRNQRCILPLMNLMLKDDGVEGRINDKG